MKHTDYDVRIILLEADLYSVDVNGETVLECLSGAEVKALTMSELIGLYEGIE